MVCYFSILQRILQRILFHHGDKYVGEFKNFEGNGQGTITWANGDKYVGESKDFKRHGQGTKTWANGDKYVGEWKDSKRHGQGTYTWVAGDKYVGKWKDGKTHGQGITTYGNGDKHVGERKDDELHGQGTYTWANGRQYVGEWKDGKRHGQGTYTYADGRVVKGISKKDKFVAETLKKNKKLTQSNVKTSFVSGLTLSEEDLLKTQIFDCWSIPLGLPYNENLLVRIKLKLKSDGTVIKSEILDHARMNQPGQGFYKVLAESALRAIRLCQPLIVPTTGYERWKVLQLNFDAREMFEG